ncbi:MAG: S-layer protein domain-containing protein [Methanosarcinales archaeon]
MDEREQPDTRVKDAVKSVSKKLTEKYVQEIVKEATKRVLRRQSEKLDEKEIIKLEKRLKKLSDKEKLDYFEEAVNSVSKDLSQAEMGSEELLEKIDASLTEVFEKKIQELLSKPILPPIAKTILIAIGIISVSLLGLVNDDTPYRVEATIDAINPNPATEGDAITVVGSGTTDDPDGYITAYEWQIESKVVSNRERFTIENLPVGRHTIEFRVRDKNGEWSEPAEAYIEVLPLPLPDLFVSEFSLDPSTPVQYDPVSVQIGLRNQGTARSDSFIVEWWAGENYREPACKWKVKSLAAGEERILTCTYEGYPSWYERLTTTVVVDSSDEVVESDEENNINRATISVSPASPAVEYVMYNVFREEELVVEGGLCEDGTKNCRKDKWGNVGGGYYATADKKVALNGHPDKLAKLILEQGIDDKKVLAVGETWDVGGDWALTVTEIDVKKRTVWISLSYNGKPIDDEPALPEGAVYTYLEDIAGETDVPMFVTYMDSVFAGATTDMVQLRYTWVMSRDATVN